MAGELGRGCERAVDGARRRLAQGGPRQRGRAGGSQEQRQGAEPDGIEAPAGFVGDPQGPQRLTPFESLFADGLMDLGDDTWSLSVSYDDTNYLLAREEDKEAMLFAYQQWLNELAEDEHVQWTFASRKVDRRRFVSDFRMDPVEGDEMGNRLRGELNAYVQDKLTAANASMRRERVVSFSTRASSHEDAARKLASTFNGFRRFVARFGCAVERLDGQDRMDLICSITKPDDEAGKYTYVTLRQSPGLRMRDLACPWRVWRPDADQDDSRLVVGSRWVRSYTIVPGGEGWGSTMSDTLLSDLSAISHDLVTSIHVSPWAVHKAVSAAANQYFDVKSENNNYIVQRSKPERGFFIDESNMPPAMLEAEEGARQTRQELAQHRQRLFGVTIVVTAICASEQELTDACHDIEAVFSAHQKPGLESWVAVREQSYVTMLPLGLNQLDYAYNMMTEPLSALVPFMSAEFQDPGGQLLGVNADTNGLLVYSRSAREHTNAIVIGQPGGGKSVFAKLQQIQVKLREPGADQIILDPEGEYVALTRLLGGQVVRISETSADHVNPLDISPYYGSAEPDLETNPLPSKVSFLQNLIQVMSHGVTDEEKNSLDAGLAYVYEPWLESRDDADIPTLGDLADVLGSDEGHMAQASHHVASLLYRFTDGTFDFFNHQTNVNLERNLVDFSLVDMSQELKPLAMMVLLDQIWVRVTKNRSQGRRTYLWVDEMQILMDDDMTRRSLDMLWTRGRKWDLYNTGITQNIARIEDVRETSYMLANSPWIVMMRQSNSYATELADTFNLSDNLKDSLVAAQRGEGVTLISSQAVHFDFTLDRKSYPNLYGLVTTSPDDIKERSRRAHGRHAQQEGGPPSGHKALAKRAPEQDDHLFPPHPRTVGLGGGAPCDTGTMTALGRGRGEPDAELAAREEAHLDEEDGSAADGASTPVASPGDRTCPSCGLEAPVGSRFCPHCGTPITTCPECGVLVDADWSACPNCGSTLAWDDAGKPHATGADEPEPDETADDPSGAIGFGRVLPKGPRGRRSATGE